LWSGCRGRTYVAAILSQPDGLLVAVIEHLHPVDDLSNTSGKGNRLREQSIDYLLVLNTVVVDADS
jgi:hypothetical protein